MVFGNFAALPPEIISAQIYSGPGAAPLLAAATAWDALAAELNSTASSYGSVISGLTEAWEGASSTSMAAAAAPYVNWLSTTAAQAEDVASQARAAASAYEAAFAATVPPPELAANRSQLASLQATNIFGQNGAAIAATEAEYGQMWAQDVATMSSYASSSTAASQLTPFAEAPATTKDTANATQMAAAASASSTSSTTSTSSWLTQVETYINSLTKQYTQSWENLLGGGTGNSEVGSLWEAGFSSVKGIGGQTTWANTVGSLWGTGAAGWKGSYAYAPWAAGMSKASLGAGLASPGRLASGISVKPVSAVLGNAPTVGKLSVPSNWATAAPAIRLSANALPATVAAAAPAIGQPGGLVNEATLGSLAGGALGSPASRIVSSSGIQQARVATGERRTTPVKLDRIIAQLQEMPDQVQHWNVDEAGLDDLVTKLRTTPGVHAVHVNEEPAAAEEQPESQLG